MASQVKNLNVKIIGRNFPITRMFQEKRKYGFSVLENDIHTRPDIIVFSGGPDINPKLYGEEKLPETSVDLIRDEHDLEFFERYKDTPKVGICRGGQFLNVMNGGAMWQHVNNHGGTHSLINLLPIYNKIDAGDEVQVSSTHHQMMIAGDDGEVVAISMDNSGTKGRATEYISGSSRKPPEYDTEVVWYEKTKTLCFQPHPEMSYPKSTCHYFFTLLNYFYR